jgi:hypothetical protein
MPTRFGDTIGGGGSGPNPSDAFTIAITANDTNATPTETTAFALTLLQNDTNNTPTETAKLNISGTGVSDTNAGQTEGRTIVVRSWATGCSSNDANQAGTANANGSNDGVFCVVKTNNALGDLTNPVILNTGSMNFPGGTVTSALIRIWFKVPARTTALDTITITATSSGGYSSTPYTHSGTALVDHSSGDFTFDISALTNTQLTNLALHANYTALVVATPETSIQIDAWSIDATETI